MPQTQSDILSLRKKIEDALGQSLAESLDAQANMMVLIYRQNGKILSSLDGLSKRVTALERRQTAAVAAREEQVENLDLPLNTKEHYQ